MAKSKLLKEKRVAEGRQDWRSVATLCSALGGELQAAGDLQGALQQHRQEREACILLQDTLGTGVAHRRIGEVLCELGETREALEHLQEHLTLATKVGSVLEQQRAYATIGRTQLDRADRAVLQAERDSAINAASVNFLHSLQKCKELPVGEVEQDELALMRCRLYLNLGLVADQKGDPSKAVGLITQASSLGRQHSFHEDLYRCHYALGTIYLKQRKYGLALEEAKHTVTLSGKLHNFERIESQKSLARISLITGDLVQAKQSYSIAYKVTVSEKGDVSELKKCVKATYELCKMDKIETQDLLEEDHMKHLEKMGDLYSQLKCPDKAVECYKKVLAEALIIDKVDDDMAPIYYSIAQTYDENKQFTEARQYYQKEYEIRLKHDPKEACTTLLAIAAVAEHLGENQYEIYKYYETALKLAVKASYPKLQIHVLRLHAGLDDVSHAQKQSLDTKIRDTLNTNGLASDCELSEDEDCAESDVSISDTDEDEDNARSGGPSVVAIKNIQKINFFGETALHKACINGDLNKAKYLVKQGHAVNVRDKAGWLPLHEACNHGFLDIVSYLLSVGARINDRGGKECNGITPIHDAASCGNWQIVKLLLQKGASVITKNDDGETPLDCLISYKDRADNLSQDDLLQFSSIQKDLKAAMIKAGCQPPSKALQTQSKIPEHSSRSNKYSHSIEEDSISNLNSSIARNHSATGNVSADNSSSEDDIISSTPIPKNAVLRYRTAITGLGSALSRKTGDAAGGSGDPQGPRTATKKAKRGLIAVEEFVGEDDFIENDVDFKSRKRKRPLSKSFLEFSNNVHERNLPRESIVNHNPRKTKQIKLTSIMACVSATSSSKKDPRNKENANNTDEFAMLDLPQLDIPHSQIIIDDDHDETPVTFHTTRPSSSTAVTVSTSTSSSIITKTVATAGPLRLRIKIEDKTLLVPIAEASRECSIEWLSAEVSRRYYQLTGIKPDISLKTSDGALLHPSDPITLVLGAEKEELLATVSGWELPPLQQRYTQDCLYYRQTPCPLITKALSDAESSSTLHLDRITRSAAQLKLVIRAVQRHTNLHTISLAHTRLGDEGFSLLLDVLPSLTGLSTINLQGSGITKKAITEWTDKIDTMAFSKSPLTNINLSYNSLLGCTLSNIAALFSFPSITSLNLMHCYLDIEQMCPIENHASVQVLKLDYNKFHWSSLKQLLSSVPNLKHLSACGLQCQADANNGIASALSNILGGGKECYLEHLDLSSTNLTPFELDTIRTYMYRCPHLNHFGLAHNPSLSGEAVCAVLTELDTNFSIPLTSLKLHGNIGVTSDAFAHSLIQLLQRKFNMQKPIHSVSYSSFPYSNLIIDTWKSLFNDKWKVNYIGKEVFLDVIH